MRQVGFTGSKHLDSGTGHQRSQFREDGFLGCGPDYSGAHLAIDEAEQGWNGLNFIPDTKVRKVVRVDVHDLHRTGARERDLVQDWPDDSARLAPWGQEGHQYRLLAPENLQLKLASPISIICAFSIFMVFDSFAGITPMAFPGNNRLSDFIMWDAICHGEHKAQLSPQHTGGEHDGSCQGEAN